MSLICKIFGHKRGCLIEILDSEAKVISTFCHRCDYIDNYLQRTTVE